MIDSWVGDDQPSLCDIRQGGIKEAAHTYANHVGCATAVWLNVIHEGVPYLHATQTNGIIRSKISQRHVGCYAWKTGKGGQAE